jgi:hypothetical protein
VARRRSNQRHVIIVLDFSPNAPHSCWPTCPTPRGDAGRTLKRDRLATRFGPWRRCPSPTVPLFGMLLLRNHPARVCSAPRYRDSARATVITTGASRWVCSAACPPVTEMAPMRPWPGADRPGDRRPNDRNLFRSRDLRTTYDLPTGSHASADRASHGSACGRGTAVDRRRRGIINAEAADLLVGFAELTGVPVIPTLMGWGTIPDNHPLMAGMVGLQTPQGLDGVRTRSRETDSHRVRLRDGRGTSPCPLVSIPEYGLVTRPNPAEWPNPSSTSRALACPSGISGGFILRYPSSTGISQRSA